MCLHVDVDTKIETANEDIICYKILRKRGNSLSFSLYMDFLYELKTLYTLDGKLQIIPETVFGNIEFGVHKGFHVYVYEADARREYEFLINRGYYHIGVYKCRIPKGANFMRGLFGDKPSIASDAIEILEEIR